MKNGNHGEEIQTGENSEVTMEMKIGKMQRHQHCRAKPNSKRQNNKCSVGGNEKMREANARTHKMTETINAV